LFKNERQLYLSLQNIIDPTNTDNAQLAIHSLPVDIVCITEYNFKRKDIVGSSKLNEIFSVFADAIRVQAKLGQQLEAYLPFDLVHHADN
jgi:hypothetical protein